MNIDKGLYFNDLRTIQAHLPENYSRTFGQMIVHYYLHLIKSPLVNRVSAGGVKHQIAKVLRGIQSNKELNKNHVTKGLLVWIAENNHLPQALPVTRLLSEKNYSITYISTKKQLLQNPLLNSYNKVLLNLPERKTATPQQAKAFETALKEAIAKCNLGAITEADIPTIVKAFREDVAYTQKLEEYLQKLIAKINPKAALIGYDIPTEGRTFTDVLNEKKIPTFMIQHGAMAKVDGIFGTHITKSIFVYGEVSKQVLRDSGCKSDIKITGAPYLDSLVQKLHAAGSRQKGKLKVLVAFSGAGHLTSTEHHKKSIAALVQVAEKNAETTEFYFKLHPKDNRGYYNTALEGKNLKNVFFALPNSQSNDIFDWALFADIMLTGASTVAIEAMLCRKPVISLDLTGDYKELSFIKEEAVKYITTTSELETVIEEAAANNFSAFDSTSNKAAHYAKKFYGATDGQAAQRCAQLIEPYLN